jgi:glycine cleavage system transcriptional repressor
VNEIAITVVGRDRPGIVADVSGRLAQLGLNLSDSTMTLLRGHFAMMLICAGAATPEAVRDILGPLAEASELDVTVREMPSDYPRVPAGVPYTLMVYGADRLGIVAALTTVVADSGGNITELTTRLAGDLYVMTAEVELPTDADVGVLSVRLSEVGASLGVGVGLRPSEADVL